METGTAMMNPDDMAAAAEAFDRFGDEADGGKTFLKFAKGEWVYGAEEYAVEEDEQWAVLVPSMERGWICWIGGQVHDERVVPVMSGRSINKHDLPDYSDEFESKEDGWNEQGSVIMRSLETGDQVVFKTSSKGGVGALGKLAKAYGGQLKKGNANAVPIVTLGTSSYKHKAYGKIYTPAIEIVEWKDGDELAQLGHEADEPEQEASPPEPPPKAEKASGRRRRNRDLDV